MQSRLFAAYANRNSAVPMGSIFTPSSSPLSASFLVSCGLSPVSRVSPRTGGKFVHGPRQRCSSAQSLPQFTSIWMSLARSLNKMRTAEGATAELLDLRQMSLSHPSLTNPARLRAEVLGRLLLLRERLKAQGVDLPGDSEFRRRNQTGNSGRSFSYPVTRSIGVGPLAYLEPRSVARALSK